MKNSSWWCLDLQFHLCCHNRVYHQKTEGIVRPVESAQFETFLAYNKDTGACQLDELVALEPWAGRLDMGLQLLTFKISLPDFYPLHVDMGPAHSTSVLSYQSG